MKPRVLNKGHDLIPEDAVYIGRPSIWGNPYVIGRDGTRAQVVRRYEKLVIDLMSEPEFCQQLQELRGKDLVCFCSPLMCHGDVLLKFANAHDPPTPRR